MYVNKRWGFIEPEELDIFIDTELHQNRINLCFVMQKNHNIEE